MRISNFVSPFPTSQALHLVPSSASPPSAPTGVGRSFREVFAETLGRVAEGERVLERSLVASMRSRKDDPTHLIALQAAVYRSAREIELLTKVVDKSTSAVRQALQSNQG